MSQSLDGVTFYNYPLSSASYRVRIALQLKGLTPEKLTNVNLRAVEQNTEDYQKVAPGGLVPAFDFGSQSFSQSLALIEWLDVTYPQTRLIPEDALEALAVREFALSISCDIHPLNNLRILKHLTGPLGQSEEVKSQWCAHWVHAGFEGLEQLLVRHQNGGPFCFGNQPTLADVCLVPQVFNANRFAVDLTSYPRIRAVYDHSQRHPAFQAACPKLDQSQIT